MDTTVANGLTKLTQFSNKNAESMTRTRIRVAEVGLAFHKKGDIA